MLKYLNVVSSLYHKTLLPSSKVLAAVFLISLTFLCTHAYGQNILGNPGFEENPPSNFGNNIGHAITPWILAPGAATPNVVKVDGPGGLNYGDNGPESDADAPGVGIDQHYYDGTNDVGHAYQAFTVPTCGAHYTGPLTYSVSGYFSSRGNDASNGEITIVEGVGVGGLTVAGPDLSISFPGDQQWRQVSGNFDLVQGNTYSFVTFFGNPANFDSGYLATQGCPTSLDITKSPTPTTVSAAGTSISYTILVTNTGTDTATSLVLSDTITSVACPTSGTNTIVSLAAGASETCTATYLVSQLDFDTRGGGDDEINNTVSVSGTSNGISISDTANADVPLLINPSISIQKVADKTLNVGVNETVTYTYLITNNGNQTITSLQVTDVHTGNGPPPVPSNEILTNDNLPLSDSVDSVANDGIWDTLGPQDEVTLTATYVVTQTDIDNLQ